MWQGLEFRGRKKWRRRKKNESFVLSTLLQVREEMSVGCFVLHGFMMAKSHDCVLQMFSGKMDDEVVVLSEMSEFFRKN